MKNLSSRSDNRSFYWALAASAALHSAALGLMPGRLPLDLPEQEPMLVQLPPAESLPQPLPVMQPPRPPQKEAAAEKRISRSPAYRPPPRLTQRESAEAAPKALPEVAPAEEQARSPAPAVPAVPGEAKAAPDASKDPGPVSSPEFSAAYLQNPKPPYPLLARRNGDAGTVLLKVLVTAQGAAGKVELERSSGSQALDQAALDTVKRWRFVPAKRGDQPVERWVMVPIHFRLGD